MDPVAVEFAPELLPDGAVDAEVIDSWEVDGCVDVLLDEMV